MSRGTRNVVVPGRGRTILQPDMDLPATSTGEAILPLRVAPDSKRVGTARDTQKVGSDTCLAAVLVPHEELSRVRALGVAREQQRAAAGGEQGADLHAALVD